jgi:hypothetical protein
MLEEVIVMAYQDEVVMLPSRAELVVRLQAARQAAEEAKRLLRARDALDKLNAAERAAQCPKPEERAE